MRVLVIGAGPSGLVALKTLRGNGFDAICVEESAFVGGTFSNKAYDDGRLVSSKHVTCFSDFRMGEDMPDHPSIDGYVRYLRMYAERFQLWHWIEFITRVVKVEKENNGGYAVELAQDGDSIHREYDAICICSGLHNVAYEPEISGLKENFKGTVFHSSLYREKEIFENKRVVVLGSGETGLDISYRAIQVSNNVTLCSRSGFLSVPYVIGDGLPLDTLITNLCECSHLHPLLEEWKLKWKFTTPFIRLGFKLGTGSSVGYNQWAGGKNPESVRRGHHIINKSTDAMPFINRAAKHRSWLGRNVYGWLDQTEVAKALPERIIQTKKSISKISENGNVVFDDGTEQEADLIVLATGYKLEFQFLYKSGSQEERKGFIQDELPNEHNIVATKDPTMAFIGFVRPNVGAIPPMSELQVMWWIQRLRGAIDGPKHTPTYRLLSPSMRTGAYGVDYGAYMHDLARDIGAEPQIVDLLWRSPRSLIAWALGQAYITFFRLRGPFVQKDAVHISETELLNPVRRRPFSANLLFVSLIILFMGLNFVAFLLSPFISVARSLRFRTTTKQKLQ